MGIAVHRARHGLICHEERDETIGASLRIYGEWAEEEIYLLSAFVRPDSVVLDVGANVGTHTLAFSRFASQGLVVAIDAQARMHELLALNVALNGVRNVSCIRAIAGQQTGVRFVAPENNQTRTNFGAVAYLDPSPASESNLSLVPLCVVALDDLCLERCELVKIDVEGMEWDVLLGARQTIARYRPPIYFEQAREDRFAEIVEFFQRAEYALFWHAADPFNRNNLRRHAENIFGGTRETNILAIPQEKKEAWQQQTSSLLPIIDASYQPPPRQGSTTGWPLPENAYANLPPVGRSALAQRIAEMSGS